MGEKTADNNIYEETEIQETAAHRVVEIISDILFYLLIVGIIVAAVMFAAGKSPGKSLLGYRYYDVLTGSMEPTYNVGDLILVKVTDPSEIQVGDTVTFNPGSTDDSYLTHRVTQKLENYMGTGNVCFKTKGDANETEDPFVIDGSRMIGIVKMKIPFVGYLVRFVQYNYIIIIILIVLFSVFFTLLKKLTEISAEIKAIEKAEEEDIEASAEEN